MKRVLDTVLACIGLLLLSPFLLILALAIKLESPGPAFFRGERVGKDGKVFRIFKFRTMVADAAQRGGGLTYRGDPRITRVGQFLRGTKLDELPQLFNIIVGDMSLVGPRPEDPRYVRLYTPHQRQVLSVRPGMTSMASVRYRHEETLLPADGWEKVYTETIMPAKLDIELNYLEHPSFAQDFLIVLATIFTLIGGAARFEAWTNAFSRTEEWFAHYVSWIAVDIPLILLAYVLGLGVRSVTANIDFASALVMSAGGVVVYISCGYFFGIYHRVWRYANAQEIVLLFLSTTTATIIVALLDLLLKERVLPLGAVWMGGFFTFCLVSVVRYRRRLMSGARQTVVSFLQIASAGHGARVLIIGAGEEGQLLAWQLQNRLQGQAYQVIGFIDSDSGKQGKRIHNIPVLGDRRHLPRIAAEMHPDLIVIALSPSQVKNPRELLELCHATSAQVKILPGMFDWLGNQEMAPGWEDVSDTDLLRRTPYQVDEEACRTLLTDRVVMVTGAAGSIGSELCHQIAVFGPKRLLLVDINETGLHDLGLELQAKTPDLQCELLLADITNEPRMKYFFATAHPQIVFHVAAYKHVPMLEAHPQEGIRVNVMGTRLLHSLAELYGAERFVLISSDKAVNPTNVLGMTKWLGEVLVTQAKRETPLLSTCVRFGNVLKSRGSVIPTFEKQIELGGPITITHPEMTRYFLTIQEAVSLVIQAVAMTHGGDLYVLDMGVPIPIMELAQRLIRAHGLRPNKDIEIRVIGPRPGEKMSEELVALNEETIPTEHPSIIRICRTQPLNLTDFSARLDYLTTIAASEADPESVRAELARLVYMLAPMPLTLDVNSVPGSDMPLLQARPTVANSFAANSANLFPAIPTVSNPHGSPAGTYPSGVVA